jgi:hypothetical protein
MTVNYYDYNISILNIKLYCKWLKKKSSRFTLHNKKINTNTIRDNNYFKITNILNSIFYSDYLRQLGIAITKFDDKCIIIKSLEYELKLYIYPYDYNKTIKNLKFECSKYSINQIIKEYLILFIDENWDLIINFIDDNYKPNDYLNVENVIVKVHGGEF